MGRGYTGVLAVSVSFFRKPLTEEDGGVPEARPLTDEVFQLNYGETRQEALDRFGPWLEDALAQGLDRWRRTL